MTRTERALQALLDTIQTNAAVFIQSSPVEYDNCPEPQRYEFGTPDLQRASQTPIVAVDIDTQQSNQLTLGQPLASRRQRVIPALVHIIHAHRDREQLLRQLIQLADLIMQILETYPQRDAYLFQSPRLADYTPPIEGKIATQPFIAVATIATNILIVHTSAKA